MRILLAALLLIASCVGAAAQGCGSTNPNCIVPTAPTNTNNNQAASTAFVQNQIAAGAIVPSVWPKDVYFGSGRPWVDVRSGSNGCAAAKGDGATDDTAAIQCQINYMNSTFGGGIVNVPLGTYLVSGGGITIKGGVQLVGAGASETVIEALTDSAVVTFDAATCNKYAALNNTWVIGYQNVAASQSTVTVGANCPVILRDDYIWFGLNGLNNGGVDSIIENVYVCGYGDAIRSTGANWYIRVKADTCAITSTNAFEQLGSTVLENHIIQSDFSGSYTNSLRINNSSSVMSISQTVFGANISIVAANFTQIDSSEIAGGITISGNGNMTFNNNIVLSSTVTPSGGLYNCAGNVNLVCPMFSQSSVIVGATGTNCALVAGDQIWHNGTNQNLAVTVKQNLGTGTALQSLNDACNAFEALEIEATNLQLTQGPLTLGLSGTLAGSVVFNNATSGTITLAPATGALSSNTLTVPNTAGNDTLAVLGTFAAPPAIGNGTPAAGAFTTLSASSTVSGTGFSTYLASPPAIGGSAAAAGSFTTLSATGVATLTGQAVHNVASTIASATAATLDDVKVSAATTTITGNTGSPITALSKFHIGQPTFTDSSAVTVTTGATLTIDNAPAQAGSVTITNAYALDVAAGSSLFGGKVFMSGLTAGSGTKALCLNATANEVQTDTSATICGISALRYKNLISEITPEQGLGVLSLRGETYRYKPDTDQDDKIHVSLIADDMAALNPACANYSPHGVENYMDRCFEAYQVAYDKKLWQIIGELRNEIADLRRGR